MFRRALIATLAAVVLTACGGTSVRRVTVTVTGPAVTATTPTQAQPAGPTAAALGFPYLATNNTTRIATDDPASQAAAAALAAYPSTIPGTHPSAVALVPTNSWQAALAASSLVAAPFHAPVLISDPGTLTPATAVALRRLAPPGAGAVSRAQVIRVGDVPATPGERSLSIAGSDPYSVAAAIDALEGRARGRRSINVVIASAQFADYAMPAAGWAAESGEPILFVNNAGVPAATQKALLAHRHPRIYVLGPPSVIPNTVLHELAAYGPVKRVGAPTAAGTSVAFAAYRDPACPSNAACAHVPGSFGWAIRSPGHGFVLLSERQPLAAAATAVLSATGTFGPQLLVADPNTLPGAVLNFFVDYTTPGFGKEGPTAAVYNHAWLIGTGAAVSPALQAQIDSLLTPVPVKTNQ